jgi:hypothetical protein
MKSQTGAIFPGLQVPKRQLSVESVRQRNAISRRAKEVVSNGLPESTRPHNKRARPARCSCSPACSPRTTAAHPPGPRRAPSEKSLLRASESGCTDWARASSPTQTDPSVFGAAPRTCGLQKYICRALVIQDPSNDENAGVRNRVCMCRQSLSKRPFAFGVVPQTGSLKIRQSLIQRLEQWWKWQASHAG